MALLGMFAGRFNPLPPAWAGETLSALCVDFVSSVSIRSRPRGREKRVHSASFGFLLTFQSAPARVGGRNMVQTLPYIIACVSIRSRPRGREKRGVAKPDALMVQFQSAPARVGGRNRYLLP